MGIATFKSLYVQTTGIFLAGGDWGGDRTAKKKAASAMMMEKVSKTML